MENVLCQWSSQFIHPLKINSLLCSQKFPSSFIIGMRSWNQKSPVLSVVITASVLAILQGFVHIHKGVNAAAGQTIWERCAIPQNCVVQIIQVITRVHQKSVPYFFSMPVSTDRPQFVNFRILTLNCQSWNTAKRGINNILDLYKVGILCLSETWETSSNPVKFRNWAVF